MFLTPDAVAAIAFHPAFMTIAIRPSCGVERNENIKMRSGDVKQFFKKPNLDVSDIVRCRDDPDLESMFQERCLGFSGSPPVQAERRGVTSRQKF